MYSRTAVSKLQTILIIDIIIVAFASGAFFYVQTLPGPELTADQTQLIGLTIEPPSVLLGQSVFASINVTNTGGEQGTYTMNLFLDNALNQNQTIKLTPSETKTVNFTISGLNEGTHIVKIGNLEGTFTVINTVALSNLAVNRTEAGVGEAVGISIMVTNRAQETGSYSLALIINDSNAQTKTGPIDAGASVNVLFEVVEQTEGTYQFTVGSLNGTFKITSGAPPPKPAEFQVTDLIIDPDVAQPGVAVNVTAKVTNVGEVGGSYSVDFSVDNEVKGTKTVQLSGGETTTVLFTTTQSTKGNYTIAVANATGILSIQPPSTIKLTNMIVKPYEVWAGQTVTVTIRGNNPGPDSGSLSLKMKIDNEVVQTKTLTMAAGAEGSVDFTIIAEPLQAGDSLTHIVDVAGMQGGYMVVKNGYHTLGVQISPRGDADFDLILPNGVKEQHTTFWSALLPEGTYTVIMPQADPTGRVTFLQWEDGSTSLSHTVTLNTRLTATATYTGGSSCPVLYMWNGTDYAYVTDVSNHGWLGYINYINDDYSLTYYRNNPWDYVPLDNSQLKPTDGNFNLSLVQKYNEIFYVDQAYMMVVDHPSNVNVYSTMVEEYLDPNYMGKIYTVSTSPLKPASAVNEKGENVMPQISKIDGVFTTGGDGIRSPAWNNINWNRITVDLGNLASAKQIKLVVKAIVNWGAPEDYGTWLNKFFEAPITSGTQVTPPPYMEVKDARGNWVRVPESRSFPLPSDGAPRTYVIDLTGLFPTNDYSLRISNFWNVTFDYIGIDVSAQQNVVTQRIDPQAYLYQEFAAGNASATGSFTKYGDVTPLLLTEDDMFVIGRQGDAVSLQFPTSQLTPVAQGMVRDYFLYESCWFKDENGNWGFGFGFTVDPLPFHNMSGFPYLPSESYPNDTAHQNYMQQWNTRVVQPPPETQTSGFSGASSAVLLAIPAVALASSAVFAFLGGRSFCLAKLKRLRK
jgi:hypothetical protein